MSTTSGLISWFGGPGDATTGPTTASGAPVTQPGIAVYNRATLGGWWLLKLPNGKLTTIQQTDIGPAPYTGRKFDFTYSALPSLGYSEKNFPTNASISGVYLGKTKSEIQSGIMPAAQSLGANVPNIAGWLQLVSAKPAFGVTTAAGSTLGPFATGALDSGNKAVQPSGPTSVVPDVAGAITGVFNQAVGDLKYAAVLAGVLVLGVILMVHGLSSDGPKSKTRVIPV